MLSDLIQVGPAYKVRADGDSIVVTLPRGWREQNDVRIGDELVPFVHKDYPSQLVQVPAREVKEIENDSTD